VIFFAPSHSDAWPRLSLDMRLVQPLPDETRTTSTALSSAIPEALRGYVGWSPYSGRSLDETAIAAALHDLAAVCASEPHRSSVDRTPPRERREAGASPSDKPAAVVFGLGNYAKTQIIPYVTPHLRIATIHEIDPDQMASASGMGATLDTSPVPRDGERFDAWFIAGFHHSHAPLAARALRDGAYAVVEKPVATTRPQFMELEEASRATDEPRLFACFHRRYSRLNDWARADLAVPRGSAVDMQCIVYEIPLPALHWYNWPNSGSRLVSNGCHWLDYFLFMNDFSAVRERFTHRLRGGDLLAHVRLENDAQLVMTLTDTGSERLGVRDVVDLRARDVTVRVIDSTYYESESTARVLRRRRVNPMRAYARMYDHIARRIARGESGDSPDSLRSTALMLDLEDELHERVPTFGRVTQ
jgi:predicted dehydrogenase